MYSQSTREQVTRIEDRLQRFSISSLHAPADDVSDESRQQRLLELVQEADAVLLLLTGSSSEHAFLRQEIDQVTSRALGKVLPLLLDKMPVPEFLANLQAFPFFEYQEAEFDSAVERLAYAIRDLVQAHRTTEQQIPEEGLKTGEPESQATDSSSTEQDDDGVAPEAPESTDDERIADEPAAATGSSEDDAEPEGAPESEVAGQSGEDLAEPAAATTRRKVSPYIAIALVLASVALFFTGNYVNRSVPEVRDGIFDSADEFTDLKAFSTDGCSAFPDGTSDQEQLWLSCCIRHDFAYWQGGSREQREQADVELEACVTGVGEPAIASLMLAGVRVGGTPHLPTRFRWGYGWPYLRGYKALTEGERQEVRIQSARAPTEIKDPATDAVEEYSLDFLLVRPQAYLMGTPNGDERPPHNVDLTTPFMIGMQEIANNVYQEYLAETGARYGPADPFAVDSRATWPVVNVSFDDAEAFTRWYSGKTKATYRLPSEAEWEWLARQSASVLDNPCATVNYRGDSLDTSLSPATNNLTGQVNDMGSDCRNESPLLVEVDAFEPDPLGIYHLFGNAAEWVQDCYADTYLYAPDDGGASESGNCDYRVYRGGSWLSRHAALTPTMRSLAPPDYRDFHLGFRLVRDLDWLDRFAIVRADTNWNGILPIAAYVFYGGAALTFITFIWLIRRGSRSSGVVPADEDVEVEQVEANKVNQQAP